MKFVVTKTIVTHNSWLVDAADEKSAELAVFRDEYSQDGVFNPKSFEQTETKSNTQITVRAFDQPMIPSETKVYEPTVTTS